MKQIKNILNKLNNKYFFGKYNNTFINTNEKTNFKHYFIRFSFIYILLTLFLYLIFNKIINAFVIAFFLTIFFINEIILNNKKLIHENYILSQLTIYTSQMTLLVSFNNIYSALKEVIKFLDYPINKDLEKVVKNIENNISISESFKDFNKKYNNRTITLFNQTLELFDNHGTSDAEYVLEIISEEMNMLKIKKDKYFKFKKEWRLNFYVVLILSLIMPLILRTMISDIYANFMNSFGTIIMIFIIIINCIVTKKVESIYKDQSIGEKGYK